MFTPNLTGKTSKRTGRDVYGQPEWGKTRECPFALIDFAIERQKTSVRADSSASRGSADERTTPLGKILVASYVAGGMAIGDRFEFGGHRFLVAGKHERYSVFGRLDHFEIDLELLP